MMWRGVLQFDFRVPDLDDVADVKVVVDGQRRRSAQPQRHVDEVVSGVAN